MTHDEFEALRRHKREHPELYLSDAEMAQLGRELKQLLSQRRLDRDRKEHEADERWERRRELLRLQAEEMRNKYGQ